MNHAPKVLYSLGVFLLVILATAQVNGQKTELKAKPTDPCCGIHSYEVDGVKVALMSVERNNVNEITVRWQYRNTTGEPKKIGESFHGMGSSEAFSLVWDAYVVDPIAKIKVSD